MKKYDSYINEIVKASVNKKLVFFIGAGLSSLSEYPKWSELVNEFNKGLYMKDRKTVYSDSDFLIIPQMFYDVKGEESYNMILEKVFSVKKSPNLIHYKILAMEPAHIVTTNYDDLIEQTCNQRGKYFSHISCEKDIAEAQTASFLLKVHGDFKDGFIGENIVLKESDYLNYESNFPLISNLMKTIIATNTIVFIGYSLNDYNINLILNWVKQLQKESYKKPFFIRTEYEKLKNNEEIYFNKKGLRIIDSTKLIDTKENDYLSRYKIIMDILLETKDDDKLETDEEIINYIYNKLSPLFLLKGIRGIDIDSIFNYHYHFEINGLIYNISGKEIKYFENFFEISNSKKSNKKVREILKFFNENNIYGLIEKAEKKILDYKLSIENLAYNNEYEAIEKFLNTKTEDLYENYKKAFYFASLGRYEDSYNLYSEIIIKTVIEKKWLLHFLSHINRFSIYHAINQLQKYFKIGIGKIIYGEGKVIDEKFAEKIDREMQGFNIFKLFSCMPAEFQENYRILEDLCDNQILFKNQVKLFELINKGRSEINSGSIQYGILTTSNEIQYRLENNISFLYDNFLFHVNFSEIKEYICTALTFQFEKAEHERTKVYSSNVPFGDIIRNNFYISYYDFINIVKSMKIEDIKNIERISRIEKFEIKDMEKIENSISRMAKFCIIHFSDSGMDFKLYNLFIREFKSAIYFSKYLILSEETINQLIRCILLYLPESDLDVGTKYSFSERILIKNKMPLSTIDIIEEFIIKQIEKINSEKISEGSSNGSFAWNFSDLIKYFYRDYASEKISYFLLEHENIGISQINYIYKVYKILTDEAKQYINKLKQIITIEDVLDGLENGSIDNILDYEELIIESIKAIFDDDKERAKKGERVIRQKNYPITFAVLYLNGDFESIKMRTLLGYNNQFDFFVDSGKFNYEKFDISWLKSYGRNILENISKNTFVKNKISEILKEKIKRIEMKSI